MKINGNTVGTPTPRTNYNQTNPKNADYLVGRENILGKDELTSATEEALRLAKESGEFDGADGVSCTHSWNGTTLTVTSASGTSSADLKGEKGDPGLGGTVNGEVPNEDGDILLYGPIEYEPKVTLGQSDMSRYLYLGSDARRWMTTPEDVTVRASFKNGAVVDFTTDNGMVVVDAEIKYLHAAIYTVTNDSRLFIVFNHKIKIDGEFGVACWPRYYIESDSYEIISDCVVAVRSSNDNLAACVLGSPVYGKQEIYLRYNGIRGENGEALPFNGDNINGYGTHIFAYAGNVDSIADLPQSIDGWCDQALMTIGDNDMLLCIGDDYIVQTVLGGYGVNTKNTYILVKEELATTVESVTILCGGQTVATLTESDVITAFFAMRGTPSFDWLTSPHDIRFTVDGNVVEDLGFNGFDKYKNIVSAYSPIGCFVSGVNGITGNGLSDEYSILMNPSVTSINQVEVGNSQWKKIPHGALPSDSVVKSGSVNLIESGAVKTYVDNTIKAYFDLIEERLLALEKAIGKEGE